MGHLSPSAISCWVGPEASFDASVTRVLFKDEEDRQKLQEMGFEANWSTTIDQLGELAAQYGSVILTSET